MSIAGDFTGSVVDADRGTALDHEPEGARLSGRGDRLAVVIYRALERGTKTDIRHVLAAIAARELSPSSLQRSSNVESAGGTQAEHAQRSLRLAIAGLGRFPSRRAYDRWRDQRPDRDRLASSSFIRKAHANSWPEALAAAGAPRTDIPARRLLSNGREFSLQERRRALRLFATAVPHGRRTTDAYRSWARKYVLEPGSVDVPVDARTFTARVGIHWFDVLIGAGLPDEASARAPSRAAGRRRQDT